MSAAFDKPWAWNAPTDHARPLMIGAALAQSFECLAPAYWSRADVKRDLSAKIPDFALWDEIWMYDKGLCHHDQGRLWLISREKV